MKPKTLETITISDFNWTDKKKDGSLCMTKERKTDDGKTIPSKPFYMCNLTCAEYKPRLYGMHFGSKSDIENIKQNDKLDLIVYEEEYEGRISLKFEFPTNKSANEAKLNSFELKIETLEKRIKKLEDTLSIKLAELKSDICLELTGKVQTKSDYDKMTDTGEVIDIPF